MNFMQWVIIILGVGILIATAIHIFGGYSARQWLRDICIKSVEGWKE